MKTCSICRQTLMLDAFHKNKAQPDGYNHRCKECRKASLTPKERDQRSAACRRYRVSHGLTSGSRRNKVAPNEVRRARTKREKASQRARLSDNYVRSLLRRQTGIPEVPAALVSAKRAVMRVERLVKERGK
jgi:hypothetical protein